MKQLFDADDAPAVVHFAKHKFTWQFACSQKIVSQCPQAVGFFQVITKNAVTNAQRFERLDIARQSQLVEFQSFDDH